MDKDCHSLEFSSHPKLKEGNGRSTPKHQQACNSNDGVVTRARLRKAKNTVENNESNAKYDVIGKRNKAKKRDSFAKNYNKDKKLDDKRNNENANQLDTESSDPRVDYNDNDKETSKEDNETLKIGVCTDTNPSDSEISTEEEFDILRVTENPEKPGEYFGAFFPAKSYPTYVLPEKYKNKTVKGFKSLAGHSREDISDDENELPSSTDVGCQTTSAQSAREEPNLMAAPEVVSESKGSKQKVKSKKSVPISHQSIPEESPARSTRSRLTCFKCNATLSSELMLDSHKVSVHKMTANTKCEGEKSRRVNSENNDATVVSFSQNIVNNINQTEVVSESKGSKQKMKSKKSVPISRQSVPEESPARSTRSRLTCFKCNATLSSELLLDSHKVGVHKMTANTKCKGEKSRRVNSENNDATDVSSSQNIVNNNNQTEVVSESKGSKQEMKSNKSVPISRQSIPEESPARSTRSRLTCFKCNATLSSELLLDSHKVSVHKMTANTKCEGEKSHRVNSENNDATVVSFSQNIVNNINQTEVVSESKGSKQKMKSKKSVPISRQSVPEESPARSTRSRLTCFKCNATLSSELLLDSHKVGVHKMTANTKCKGEKSRRVNSENNDATVVSSSQNIANNNNQTKNSQQSCQKITETQSQSSRGKSSRMLLGKRSTCALTSNENKATESSCTVNKMPFIEADKDSSLTKVVSNLSCTIVPVTNVSADKRSAQNDQPNLLRNGRKRNSCCNDDSCISFKRRPIELTPESETQRDVSSFSVETSEKFLQSSVEIIVEDVMKSQNASLILKKCKVKRVFSQNTNVTHSFLNLEKSNHDPKTVPNSKGFCDTAASGEDILKDVAQEQDKTIKYPKRLPNSNDDCDKVQEESKDSRRSLTSSSDEEITHVHLKNLDESNRDHLNALSSDEDCNTILVKESRHSLGPQTLQGLRQNLDKSNKDHHNVPTSKNDCNSILAVVVEESYHSLRPETPPGDEEVTKVLLQHESNKDHHSAPTSKDDSTTILVEESYHSLRPETPPSDEEVPRVLPQHESNDALLVKESVESLRPDTPVCDEEIDKFTICLVNNISSSQITKLISESSQKLPKSISSSQISANDPELPQTPSRNTQSVSRASTPKKLFTKSSKGKKTITKSSKGKKNVKTSKPKKILPTTSTQEKNVPSTSTQKISIPKNQHRRNQTSTNCFELDEEILVQNAINAALKPCSRLKNQKGQKIKSKTVPNSSKHNASFPEVSEQNTCVHEISTQNASLHEISAQNASVHENPAPDTTVHENSAPDTTVHGNPAPDTTVHENPAQTPAVCNISKQNSTLRATSNQVLSITLENQSTKYRFQVIEANRKELYVNGKCPYCKCIVGSTTWDVQNHVSQSHPYKCTTCKTVFDNGKDLTRHRYTMHTGQLHECFICESYFMSKRNYDNHMNSHNHKQMESKTRKIIGAVVDELPINLPPSQQQPVTNKLEEVFKVNPNVKHFKYGVPIIEGAKEQLSSAIQRAASASSIHSSDSSFSLLSGGSVNLSPSTPTNFQREDFATIYDQECTRNVSMRASTIPQLMEEFERFAENTTSSADETQSSAPSEVQETQIIDETQSSAPSEVQGTQIIDGTQSSALSEVQETLIIDETQSSASYEVQETQIIDETQSSPPYAVHWTEIIDETQSSPPYAVQWTQIVDETQSSAPSVVQETQIADETQSSAPSVVQEIQIIDGTQSSAPSEVQGTQIADETQSSAPSVVQGTQIADETQSSAPSEVQGTQIIDETNTSAPSEVQGTQIIDGTQSSAPSVVQGTQIADETQSSAPSVVQGTQIADETQSSAPYAVQLTQIIDETQSSAPSEVQGTQIADETQSSVSAEVQETQLAENVNWIDFTYSGMSNSIGTEQSCFSSSQLSFTSVANQDKTELLGDSEKNYFIDDFLESGVLNFSEEELFNSVNNLNQLMRTPEKNEALSCRTLNTPTFEMSGSFSSP